MPSKNVVKKRNSEYLVPKPTPWSAGTSMLPFVSVFPGNDAGTPIMERQNRHRKFRQDRWLASMPSNDSKSDCGKNKVSIPEEKPKTRQTYKPTILSRTNDSKSDCRINKDAIPEEMPETVQLRKPIFFSKRRHSEPTPQAKKDAQNDFVARMSRAKARPRTLHVYYQNRTTVQKPSSKSPVETVTISGGKQETVQQEKKDAQKNFVTRVSRAKKATTWHSTCVLSQPRNS